MAAHGNFDSAHCISTGQEVPPAEVASAIMARLHPPQPAVVVNKGGEVIKLRIKIFRNENDTQNTYLKHLTRNAKIPQALGVDRVESPSINLPLVCVICKPGRHFVV